MSASRAAWLLPLVFACRGGVTLDPLIAEGTQAALLITRSGMAGVRVEALDTSDHQAARSELAEEDEQELTALLYPWPLFDLNLEPGVVPLLEGGAPVPDAPIRYRAALDGGDKPSWTQLAAMPEDLETIRLDLITPRACLEGGGCLEARVPDHAGTCARPCKTPEPPLPPEPPELPVFLPCPPGWSELPVPEEPFSVCAPFPGDRAASCPVGQSHFPGEAGCIALGPACPSGTFADDLPAGRSTVFVDPSAAAGGSGSRAAPFSRLSDAINATPPNGVIAIGAGELNERIAGLQDGVSIIGACAERSLIRTSSDSNALALLVRVHVELVGLSLSSENQTLFLQEGELRMRGVRMLSSLGVVLGIYASHLDLDGVELVGGTSGLNASGGSSIVAHHLATSHQAYAGVSLGGLPTQTATITDSVLSPGEELGLDLGAGSFVGRRLVTAGIDAQNGGHDLLEDVWLAGSRRSGLRVTTGARVVAKRMRIEHTQRAGVSANADAGNLRLSDSLIRDTEPDPTGGYGYGLEAFGPTELYGVRVVIVRAREIAVRMGGQPFTAVLEDLVVRDTRAKASDELAGYGMFVDRPNVSLQLRRARFQRNRALGVVAKGSALLDLEDVQILDTRPSAFDGALGRGLQAEAAGHVTGRRVELARNHSLGIYVGDQRTQVTLEDVRVTQTSSSACPDLICNVGFDDGVAVTLEGSMALRHFAVVDNGTYGIRLTNESTLELEHGTISGHQTGVQIVRENFRFEPIAFGVVLDDNLTPIALLDQ